MTGTASPTARDNEQSTPGDGAALRVFVVDEEAPVTQLLSLALGMEGWEAHVFPTGRAAVEAAIRDQPDAILLDMMLPDVSGVEVVAELRRAGVTTPVLFLTGRDSLEDRLAAFGAGADDYVTKPFGLEEVVDTLRALFRKRGLVASMITVDDLVLDPATGEAWLAGVPLVLDPVDLAVVQALAEEPHHRLPQREVVHRLVDAGAEPVTPHALLGLPAVTGRRAGREHPVLIAVAGDDLVLAPVR